MVENANGINDVKKKIKRYAATFGIICLSLITFIHDVSFALPKDRNASSKHQDIENSRQVSDTESTLIFVSGLDQEKILLTRTTELAVFSQKIGNNDNTTDSYRIFPFYLVKECGIGIRLLDGIRKPVNTPLIKEQKLKPEQNRNKNKMIN